MRILILILIILLSEHAVAKSVDNWRDSLLKAYNQSKGADHYLASMELARYFDSDKYVFPVSEIKAQHSVVEDLVTDFINTLEKIQPEKSDTVHNLTDTFIHKTLQLDDEEALQNLLRAGIFLSSHLNKESAGNCLKIGLQRSKTSGNTFKEVEFHLALTDLYFLNMQTDSARFHNDLAYTMTQELNETKYNSQIYNDKARIAEVSGNRLQAIDWYLQDVEMLKNNNDTARLAVVLNNIAVLHINMKSFDQAISYIIESIKLNEFLADEYSLCDSYNNLAVSYKEIDNLEQSIFYYQKAIDLAKKTNNDYQLARAFMNLSNSEVLLGNYSTADAYLDSSAILCEVNNIDVGLLLNKLNRGEFYLTTAQYSKGLEQLQEAEKQNSQYHLPDITVELWRLLSQAYEKNNDYPKALSYYKKYITLSDSVSGAETKRLIIEMQMRYNEEHSARQLAQLQQSLDKQKTQTWYIFIGLGFAISIIVLLLALNYVLRRSSNYKNRLAIEEAEKLRLSMEMKDQELVSKAMNMSKINQMVLDVGSELKKVLPGLTREKTESLQHLLHDLENSLPSEAWKEFETRFEQVHKSFYDKLTVLHPDLSPTELKICGFLRLNLTTKDIAILTNRSVGTIDNTRSAIRRKMNLENDSNLTHFLLSL